MTAGLLPPRVYINAFPKAGTHMVERMAQHVAMPAAKVPWLGSFTMNAWANEWLDSVGLVNAIFNIKPGSYAKGHCGYKNELSQALYQQGVGVVFVYRNLRDVAISQAHHVLSADDDTLQHPCKELYRCMTSFEDVLLAVIDGYGSFPGIWQRWYNYASWLTVPWVLSLRYEDVMEDPHEAATLFLRYVYGRQAQHEGKRVTLHEGDINRMASDIVASIERRDTPTFRQGNTHGWTFCDDWTARVEGAYQAGRSWFKREVTKQLVALHQANGHKPQRQQVNA